MSIVARMEPMPRFDYEGPALDEAHLPPTPYHTINHWCGDAIARAREVGDIKEPGALQLATADASGQPSVRTVLLRFLDERGPGFVTHSTSAKCADIAANPKLAASLVWMPLFRQIRFSGVAERIDDAEIEEYWHTRPRGAQLAAIAVRQGEPVASRQEMEARYDEVAARYPEDEPVPMPDTFTGFRIRCRSVELWSGRAHRLHDRIVYTNPADLSLADPGWHVTRLQP